MPTFRFLRAFLFPLLMGSAVSLAFSLEARHPIPALKAANRWDVPGIGEPSGLAALPDGRLLTVGDGVRGRISRMRIQGDRLETAPGILDLRKVQGLREDAFADTHNAPDLEGLAVAPDGRWLILSEYHNEVWALRPDLKRSAGRWQGPRLERQGSFEECAGGYLNHQAEGMAYDAGRKQILFAMERCPPSLALVDEQDGTQLHLWDRKTLQDALDRWTGQQGLPRQTLRSFGDITHTGKPGEYLAVDRTARLLWQVQISTDLRLRVTGLWDFGGVFREEGLAIRFGNVEGVTLAGPWLYLITDPGNRYTPQLARFAWPR